MRRTAISSPSSNSNSSLSSVSSAELPEVAGPVTPCSSSSVRIKMIRKRIESGGNSTNSSRKTTRGTLACPDEMGPSESESDREWVIDEERKRAAAAVRSEDEDGNSTKSRNSSGIRKLLPNRDRGPGPNWQPQEWHGINVKRERQSSSPGPQKPQSNEEEEWDQPLKPLRVSALDLAQQSRMLTLWNNSNFPNLGNVSIGLANNATQQKLQENPPRRRIRRPRLQLSMKICKEIISEMMSKSNKSWCWPFYKPIYKGINGNGTGNIFEHPIYLGEIKARVMNREYSEAEEFVADMKTLLNNFLSHFESNHEFHENAIKLQEMFEKGYKRLRENGKISSRGKRRCRTQVLPANYEKPVIVKQAAEIQTRMALAMRNLVPPSIGMTSSSTSGNQNYLKKVNATLPDKLESNGQSAKKAITTPESYVSSGTMSSSSTSATSSYVSPISPSLNSAWNNSSEQNPDTDKPLNLNINETPISAYDVTVPKRKIEIQSVSDSITKKTKVANAGSSVEVTRTASPPIKESVPATPPGSVQIGNAGEGLTSAEGGGDLKINLSDKVSLKNLGCQWLMVAINQLATNFTFSERISKILGQDFSRLQESQLRELDPDKLLAVAACVSEFVFSTGIQRTNQVNEELLNHCSSMVEETSSQWLKMQELLSAAQRSCCETMVQMQRMQEHGIMTYQRIFESTILSKSGTTTGTSN